MNFAFIVVFVAILTDCTRGSGLFFDKHSECVNSANFKSASLVFYEPSALFPYIQDVLKKSGGLCATFFISPAWVSSTSVSAQQMLDALKANQGNNLGLLVTQATFDLWLGGNFSGAEAAIMADLNALKTLLGASSPNFLKFAAFDTVAKKNISTLEGSFKSLSNERFVEFVTWMYKKVSLVFVNTSLDDEFLTDASRKPFIHFPNAVGRFYDGIVQEASKDDSKKVMHAFVRTNPDSAEGNAVFLQETIAALAAKNIQIVPLNVCLGLRLVKVDSKASPSLPSVSVAVPNSTAAVIVGSPPTSTPLVNDPSPLFVDVDSFSEDCEEESVEIRAKGVKSKKACACGCSKNGKKCKKEIVKKQSAKKKRRSSSSSSGRISEKIVKKSKKKGKRNFKEECPSCSDSVEVVDDASASGALQAFESPALRSIVFGMLILAAIFI